MISIIHMYLDYHSFVVLVQALFVSFLLEVDPATNLSRFCFGLMAQSQEAIPHNQIYQGSVLKNVDGEMVSTLAERMHQIKPSTDVAELNGRVRCRMCTQKVITHMIRFPDSSIDLWASIESNVLSQPRPDVSVPGEKKADAVLESPAITASTFGTLSYSIKAGVYCAMRGGDTRDLLDKINVYDSHAIHDIFSQHFQVDRYDNIPKPVNEQVL